MKKILTIFGTRPEAIKLAPVVKELERHADVLESKVCVTGQHRQMLDQVLEIYDIKPEYDLNVMKDNQTLAGLTATIMRDLTTVLEAERPDAILVQGDTTTTFVAALAAFYLRLKVGHVEAGLRTRDRFNPFPEEVNRKLCSVVTDFHFCPTGVNRDALLEEGYPAEQIYITGNTIVDSLLYVIDRVKAAPQEQFLARFPKVDFSKRLILVTGHRRESFGGEFENICNAIKYIASENPDVEVLYPVHLNPNVQKPVYSILSDVPNVHLCKPADYRTFVWLMDKAHIILTDSGGIQEEAPTLRKPALVMRRTTERREAIDAGIARLVGTDPREIIDNMTELLHNSDTYAQMTGSENPFGDGKASQRIVQILMDKLVAGG